MPRYFFNVAGAEYDADNVGVELGNMENARIMAAKVSGELLQDRPDLVWMGEEFRVEVIESHQHEDIAQPMMKTTGMSKEGTDAGRRCARAEAPIWRCSGTAAFRHRRRSWAMAPSAMKHQGTIILWERPDSTR